jgi:hypothetical protein
MHKDIEYERDGVKKFAQERFKDVLIEAGWSVVENKPPARSKKAVEDKQED